nr:MAG TPA: hypothetical protein [Caudoviricetes sp.]
MDLTRRKQEIPLFYKWWDELRQTFIVYIDGTTVNDERRE